jgi:Ca-activated chloride channel family protein
MYQLDHPWLLALLPLPLVVWWLFPPYKEHSPALRLPFFTEVAGAAGVSPAPGAVVLRTVWLQKICAPIVWGLVVLALARPQYVEPPITKILPARDLLLALDLSQSMDTRDFRDPSGGLETRASAVKTVVDGFIARRTGDRIGLIGFGDAPYPLVPFTLDHTTVRAVLSGSVPGMAGPRTSMGDAIGLAIKMFESSKAPEKVLIVLSDGNDTASKMPPQKAADIARDRGVRIHAVGIGDPQSTGEDRLDQAMLDHVASTTGGRFFFGGDQAQLASIYDTLDKITPANHETLAWQPRRDLGWYAVGGATLISAVCVLLLAMWATVRRVRSDAADRADRKEAA